MKSVAKMKQGDVIINGLNAWKPYLFIARDTIRNFHNDIHYATTGIL